MREARNKPHCTCEFGNAKVEYYHKLDRVVVTCNEGYKLPGLQSRYDNWWLWHKYERRSDTQGGILRPLMEIAGQPLYTCDQSCVPKTTAATTTCAYGNATVTPKNQTKVNDQSIHHDLVRIECHDGFVLPGLNVQADDFWLDPKTGNLRQGKQVEFPGHSWYGNQNQCGNSCVPKELECDFGNATLIRTNHRNELNDQLVAVECDDDYVLPGTDLQAHDFWYEHLDETHGGMLRPNGNADSVPLYTCDNKCVPRKSACDFGNATLTTTKHRSVNEQNEPFELVRVECDGDYVLAGNGESSGTFWHGYFQQDWRLRGSIYHWTADFTLENWNPHRYHCSDSCVPKIESGDYSQYNTIGSYPRRATTTTTTTECNFGQSVAHFNKGIAYIECEIIWANERFELPGIDYKHDNMYGMGREDDTFEYKNFNKYNALMKSRHDDSAPLYACGNSCIKTVTCERRHTEDNVPVAALHMQQVGSSRRRQTVDVSCRNNWSRKVTLICNAFGKYEHLRGDCSETSSRLLLD